MPTCCTTFHSRRFVPSSSLQTPFDVRTYQASQSANEPLLHTWHCLDRERNSELNNQPGPGESLLLRNFRSTVSVHLAPLLCTQAGPLVVASPVVTQGPATSAGCWVKWLGRAEVGRERISLGTLGRAKWPMCCDCTSWVSWLRSSCRGLPWLWVCGCGF